MKFSKAKLSLFSVLVFSSLSSYASSTETTAISLWPKAEIRANVAAIQDMPNSVDDVIIWNFRVEQNGCEATLIFEVDQRNGWHVYSQNSPDGAVNHPTTFSFASSSAYELVGKVTESTTKVKDNGGFMERYFDGSKAVFKQKIKIKSAKDFKIKADYEFMACKLSCFPPEFREYEFKLKGCTGDNAAIGNEDNTDNSASTNTIPNDSIPSSSHVKSPVGWQFFAVRYSANEYELRAMPIRTQEAMEWRVIGGSNFIEKLNFVKESHWNSKQEIKAAEWEKFAGYDVFPENGYVSMRINLIDTTQKRINGTMSFSAFNDKELAIISEQVAFTIDLEKASTESEIDRTTGSNWTIFLIAFGSGLLALLTPCVFPMIPLTVSFFTKSSTNRRKGIISGITYGGSIFSIYILLSVPFHLLDSLNPNILNEISTNVPLNIFFFLMLFIFGLSFLGAFEITIPSRFTNKVDSASNVGGFIGTFLMALTLALVSFSCTGPILGSLLAGASGGGAWPLTAGMAGFGLALGLPFGLFAVFPGWLNTLPKSGGWLNSVKVVLGLLEIAFAFKFLSNADMVVQAHLLEREVFIAIWVGVFLTLSLYLFGVFRTKHDSEPKGGLNTFRLVMGILALSFTMYLIPGMMGAPLKLIGAFPPPMSYSERGVEVIVGEGAPESACEGGEAGVHGLALYHNYDDALKCAREKKLPLMIDFTGYACVNCRLMEQNVWSDPAVLSILRDKVVIASLHVDDRTKLAKPETAPDGKELTTYGDKWSNLQKRKYLSSAQPQYILLDLNEEMLNSDANYESHGNASNFKVWLDKGLAEFEVRKDRETIYPEVIEVPMAALAP